MRRYILTLLCFLVISVSFAQTRIGTVWVPNKTTAFAQIMPANVSFVYENDSNATYKLTAKFSAVQTMNDVFVSGNYIKMNETGTVPVIDTTQLKVYGSIYFRGGSGDANLSGGGLNATDGLWIHSYGIGTRQFIPQNIANSDIGGLGFIPSFGNSYAIVKYVTTLGGFFGNSVLRMNYIAKRAYGYSHDYIMTDSTHSSVVLKDEVYLPNMSKFTGMPDSIFVSVPSAITGVMPIIRRMGVAPISILPFPNIADSNLIKLHGYATTKWCVDNFAPASEMSSYMIKDDSISKGGFYPWWTAIYSLSLKAPLASPLFTGNVGVGATNPFHKLVVVTGAATNLNGFNIVNKDVNKNRNSLAQAIDSSSYSFNYSATGKPSLNIVDNTATSVFSLDTMGRVKVKELYSDLDFQGLAWNENTDQYVRLGTLTGKALNATPGDNLMPVQRDMKGCVMNDAGVVQYYLFPGDWTYKEDFTVSNLTGTDGQVMIEIPKFYYKYQYAGGWHIWKISKYPLTGYSLHQAFTPGGVTNNFSYVGAYEGILYDNSASIYANGIYMPAHSVSFTAGTKTIAKLAGSVATVNMTGANGGTGYTNGDVLTLVGGTGATVTATVAGGIVTGVTFLTKGYGYTTGVKATTYGGAGINCTVNIAALEVLSAPYATLMAGDKITCSGGTLNNGTFTVVTTGGTSITVAETVQDEPYMPNIVMTTQRDYTATTGDKLSSVSGKIPITYLSIAECRTLATNRGTGWHQFSYAQVNAIELLGLIEYGSFYWQNIADIGPGITAIADWLSYNNYNPFVASGNGNTIGNYSGDNAGATTCSAEKSKYSRYRGIENFYGHVYKWVDGIKVSSTNKAYVTNNYVNFSDASDSTNYTFAGTMPASNEYQQKLLNSATVMLPSVVGSPGTGSARITDYYYQSTGWRVAGFGGYAADGASAGGWYWFFYYSSGVRDRSISGRASFK